MNGKHQPSTAVGVRNVAPDNIYTCAFRLEENLKGLNYMGAQNMLSCKEFDSHYYLLRHFYGSPVIPSKAYNKLRIYCTLCTPSSSNIVLQKLRSKYSITTQEKRLCFYNNLCLRNTKAFHLRCDY